MMTTTTANPIVTEVTSRLESLPTFRQHEVLKFVRELSSTSLTGVGGEELLVFAGEFSNDDIESMADAIATGCEHADLNAW